MSSRAHHPVQTSSKIQTSNCGTMSRLAKSRDTVKKRALTAWQPFSVRKSIPTKATRSNRLHLLSQMTKIALRLYKSSRSYLV